MLNPETLHALTECAKALTDLLKEVGVVVALLASAGGGFLAWRRRRKP